MDRVRGNLPPRFDTFDLALLDDPYPTYARLREAGALCRGGLGLWVVPRYTDVAALLRDQRLGQFQFPEAYRLFPEASLRLSLGNGPASVFTQRIIAGRDRPDHTRIRRVIGQAFTLKLVPGLRSRVADLVDELLTPALDRGVLDAVAELAFPLPLLVLGEIIGIPAEDRYQAGRQALKLTRIFTPVVPERDRVAADEAVMWLRDYFGGLLAGRRRKPGDDLLSRMLVAAEGSRLSDEEIIDNAIFVLFAGFETSMSLIATGCAALLDYPDQLARLRVDRSLVPTAVEEFLRFDAPTQLTGRIVLAPIEVGGRTIRPGRVVLLLLGSANHDERQFAHPEQLDIGRDPNPHLSFGGGIHSCLGATLARIEGAVVFDRLSQGLTIFERTGTVVREHSATLRAYTSIPIRVKTS